MARTTKIVSISLDPQTYWVLRTLCVSENRSASNMISHLVKTYWKLKEGEEVKLSTHEADLERIEETGK